MYLQRVILASHIAQAFPFCRKHHTIICCGSWSNHRRSRTYTDGIFNGPENFQCTIDMVETSFAIFSGMGGTHHLLRQYLLKFCRPLLPPVFAINHIITAPSPQHFQVLFGLDVLA
jgi:hypothetical protein